MSNLSQLFDAGRFPGGVEVCPDGKEKSARGGTRMENPNKS